MQKRSLASAAALVWIAGCGLLVSEDFGAAVLGEPEAGVRPTGCVPQACPTGACGAFPDGCGGLQECGGCADPALSCKAGQCVCKPERGCRALGVECGLANDGCGGALDCAACGTANTACISGQCECQPTGCADKCGQQPNGCLDVQVCPACPAGQQCGGGGADLCGTGECVELTCTGEAGQRCGRVSNGCGVIIECGECTLPQVCGGGGTANVCGCTPKTCAQLGAECGTVADDGCGNALVCEGQCTAPDTCGGVVTEPNRCGCTPKSCAAQGRNCGETTDTCGTPLGSCGVCTGGQVCSAEGRCGDTCTRPSQASICAGKCGTVADPCGGAPFECGGCAGGPNYQCTSNTCTCVPTPQATACSGLGCGSAPTGCGDSWSCPNTCAGGRVCSGTTCTCPEAPQCAPGQCSSTSNACGSTRVCDSCTGMLECQANGYCACPVGTNQCGNGVFASCCGGGTPFCIPQGPEGGCCSSNGQICELQ